MSNDLTISYQFQQYGLWLQVVVQPSPSKYQAASGQAYHGYAIISGKGTYQVHGTPFSFKIAPQSVNPFNVLWKSTSDGDGGSSKGIDTNGLNIEGDNGQLYWSGSGQMNFGIQEGAIPSGALLTLGSCKNWPPPL